MYLKYWTSKGWSRPYFRELCLPGRFRKTPFTDIERTAWNGVHQHKRNEGHGEHHKDETNRSSNHISSQEAMPFAQNSKLTADLRSLALGRVGHGLNRRPSLSN